jgi:hypothetical protein
MRRANVRELVEKIGVRLQAGRRTLIFCQERDAIIDHVVGEAPAVGVSRRFRRVETQQTVRTIRFGQGWPNAPDRTLLTRFVKQWIGNESRAQESRCDEPVIGKP